MASNYPSGLYPSQRPPGFAPYQQLNDENNLGVIGDDPSFESDGYLQMSVNWFPVDVVVGGTQVEVAQSIPQVVQAFVVEEARAVNDEEESNPVIEGNEIVGSEASGQAEAERIAAEAEARRTTANRDPSATEIGGSDGPEPTRYGDWEKKGIAHDF